MKSLITITWNVSGLEPTGCGIRSAEPEIRDSRSEGPKDHNLNHAMPADHESSGDEHRSHRRSLRL